MIHTHRNTYGIYAPYFSLNIGDSSYIYNQAIYLEGSIFRNTIYLYQIQTFMDPLNV